MIVGYISARHALVPLNLRGANGLGTVDFVLDSGFVGFLAMSQQDVIVLGLTYSHSTPACLADGSKAMLAVYRVIIVWDGEELDVKVLATGNERLLGTSLLDGYDVHIQFAEGGQVIIERL